MIFQGEEWAARTPFYYFTDYQEPELARAVREGRCREFAMFGWKPEDTPDPQARATFEQSKLNWSELAREPHPELLDWHWRLIRLRRAESALTNGRLDQVHVRFSEPARWLVLERETISVVCNFAQEAQAIPLCPGAHRLLLASEADLKLEDRIVTLPPESVAILKSGKS